MNQDRAKPSVLALHRRGRAALSFRAMFELVERVTVLQEGRVLVEGTPEQIKGNAKVQEAYLGGVHGVLAAE